MEEDPLSIVKVGTKVFLTFNGRVGSVVPATPGIIFIDEAEFDKASAPTDEKSICFRWTYIEASYGPFHMMIPSGLTLIVKRS